VVEHVQAPDRFAVAFPALLHVVDFSDLYGGYVSVLGQTGDLDARETAPPVGSVSRHEDLCGRHNQVRLPQPPTHRVLENSPERAVFELDYLYPDKLGGETVRETKRITVLLGQRLFQCESKFTVGGKPAALDVAIGLKPQTDGAKPVFAPKSGIMSLWEHLGGELGQLGTGIVVDPARVTKMITHTDADGQTQALCLARTAPDGTIRWFAGFGWDGQGEIKSADQWQTYLRTFAAAHTRK